MSIKKSTNELLGYSPDARLLILNGDDFGMCHSINMATIQAIREGLVASCTLMIPCPWNLHAIQLLKDNPDIPFGVHLTAVSEAPQYRWGPKTPLDKVPTLLDEDGYFYSEERIGEFLDQVNLDELELEFRAQIEAVLATGLQPTHLDSHCNVHTRRIEVFELTFHLAQEYGVALRVHTPPIIEYMRNTDYPASDHGTLDSYRLVPAEKRETYSKLLRELPAGLSEWALHPGIGNDELKAAIGPSWDTRQADFDYFTSQEAKQIIEEEGIVVLSYERLQPFWQA